MTRRLSFAKMHGAGNDFVMIDGRDLTGGGLSPANVAALCHRRKGVGADGLIVIDPQPTSGDDFGMVYYNADGHEAEMCGNGARCSVAFARRRGLIDGPCTFATASGSLTGEPLPDGTVDISLPAWTDLEMSVTPTDSPWSAHHGCNTGVPHLVIRVEDIDAVDVATWGRRLRLDPVFAPAGTNVNWVAPAADGAFAMRTYERGVEAETLACGTGAAATAVVLCHLQEATSPVLLNTRGGDRLIVSVDVTDKALRLRGPAVTSFIGEVEIDD